MLKDEIKGEPLYEVNIFRCQPSLRREFNRALVFYGFSNFTDAIRYYMRELVSLYEKEQENGKTGIPPKIFAGNVSKRSA